MFEGGDGAGAGAREAALSAALSAAASIAKFGSAGTGAAGRCCPSLLRTRSRLVYLRMFKLREGLGVIVVKDYTFFFNGVVGYTFSLC